MGNPTGKTSTSRARGRVIRARMAMTGEPWTVAARFVDANRMTAVFELTRMTMEIDAEVRRIRLLDRLYGFEPANPGLMPSVTDVIDPDELGVDNEQLWRDILRALDREGLIKLAETMGFEGTSMVLTHAGRVEVEARRARRRDPARRNLAARDAVVRWLYARPGHEASGVEPMTADPGYLYEAEPFTITDLNAALTYLVNAGLVAGVAAFGAPVVRPRLTSKGVDCAEQFGGSVSDYVRRSAGGDTQHHVNFNGAVSGNVSWSSEHVTQTATTGLAATELLSVVRAIAEALPVLGLSTEQADQVRSDLSMIEGELATKQPDRNLIKTLMGRAAAALGTATTSALASMLRASVEELMRRAGMPPA
jgi:hypothetical protein